MTDAIGQIIVAMRYNKNVVLPEKTQLASQPSWFSEKTQVGAGLPGARLVRGLVRGLAWRGPGAGLVLLRRPPSATSTLGLGLFLPELVMESAQASGTSLMLRTKGRPLAKSAS